MLEASLTLLEQLFQSRGLPFGSYDSAVEIPVDHIYGHDRNTFKIINEVEGELGKSFEEARALQKFHLFLDHYAPPPTIELAALHTQQRRLASSYSLNLSDVGNGVGHQVGIEQIVGGGEIVVGVDSHTCTVGALGSLGFRQPPTAVAKAIVENSVRFDIPHIIRIELGGTLPPNCCAKDIMLALAASERDLLEDKVMEFGGPGLRSLSISGRFTLANLSVDLNARTALVETDLITEKYLTEAGRGDTFLLLQSDVSSYSNVIELDLSTLQPMVSPPPSIFNSCPVKELADELPLDVVTIGSCTNGRYEDFLDFFSTFGKGPIADGTRLIATPASRAIYKRLHAEGYIDLLLDVGAVINPPGCGPCMGLHQGVLDGGEICLATGSRNSPGRMGSRDAKVYLCGPKVAGISARLGRLTEPTLGNH